MNNNEEIIKMSAPMEIIYYFFDGTEIKINNSMLSDDEDKARTHYVLQRDSIKSFSYAQCTLSKKALIPRVVESWNYPSMKKNYPKYSEGFKVIVSVSDQICYIIHKDTLLYVMHIYGKGKYIPRGFFKTQGIQGKSFYNKTLHCGASYFSSFAGYGEYLFHSVLTDKSGNVITAIANDSEAISHGCIRLSVPDAKWISECPYTMKVYIR